MSNPPNRLAAYRSYAYYHVLAMCDSTQTADQLAQETSVDVWEHATQATAVTNNVSGTENLGPYSPKQASNGAGRYIILINGAVDANYVITRVLMSSATAASAVPNDRYTSIAIEGSLAVSEPKGVAFLDQIVKCSVALGVDSSQVVFVLKTFFIGYGSTDGYQPNDNITDIAPMTFMVYDVTGTFSEEGGTYEMQFVAAGHGAARLPQYSKSVNSFSVKAGATLQQTMLNLMNNINVQYALYFQCVTDQIAAIQGVDTSTLLKLLRRVNYVIEVSPDYQDVNGKSKYIVSDQPVQYKSTSNCDDAAQLTFPPHTSIESAISTIMSYCPQVQTDMGVGDTSDKKKYEYKIHTTVKSERLASSTDNEFTYTVYYRVDRSLTPKTISYDPAFQVLSKDEAQLKQDPQYDLISRNIIEFDYLYTGNNIDILDFDMKINMGMAYIQTATLANTFKSQIERAPNRQQQSSGQDIGTQPVKFNGPGVQVPVYFGAQIQLPFMSNAQDAGRSIQGAYTLTKHASLEVSEVTMKIYGNTEILGSINKTSSATNVSTQPSTVQPVNSPTTASFPDWSHVPAFAKVRIKMPRNNDDFSLYTGLSTSPTDVGTDYARDFWFDGYYYVYGIDHLFDNGEFTQTLQMMGLQRKSSFQATQQTATEDPDVNTKVDSCFDNKVGCGPSTPIVSTSGSSTQPNVAIPHPAPVYTNCSKKITSLSFADARSANARATSPSQVGSVIPWEKASSDVQTAILTAASQYPTSGVNVATVLAQIAHQESKLGTQNKNPKSTAVGLFQYVQKTWLGLIDHGKLPGISDSLADSVQLEYRTNVSYSAQAAAQDIQSNSKIIGSTETGDIYLAHFAGPYIAKKVIQADNSGQGNKLMYDIEGFYKTGKLAGQSIWVHTLSENTGSCFSTDTTATEFRTWAAVVMALTLKQQVATAKKPVVATAAPKVPSSPPPAQAQVKAKDKVAICQDCATQNDKKDTKDCGSKVGTKTQDAQTQPTAATTPATAGGANTKNA